MLYQPRENQLHRIPNLVSFMRPGMIYLYFGGKGQRRTTSSWAPPISVLGVKLIMASFDNEE